MERVRGSSVIQMVSFCNNLIETIVTDRPSVVDEWLHSILHNKKENGRKIIVGLNCKFKPYPIRSMSERIATLQLCVDTNCLILQLSYLDFIPQSVNNFLNHRNISLFGIQVHEIASKLWREYGIDCREKIIDIRAMVKMLFPMSYGSGKASSLKSIAYQVGGLSMRKHMKLSCKCDWDFRVLDVELVEYACVDAYVVYRIAYTLLN